jgi:hypothetical protein
MDTQRGQAMVGKSLQALLTASMVHRGVCNSVAEVAGNRGRCSHRPKGSLCRNLAMSLAARSQVEAAVFPAELRSAEIAATRHARIIIVTISDALPAARTLIVQRAHQVTDLKCS